MDQKFHQGNGEEDFNLSNVVMGKATGLGNRQDVENEGERRIQDEAKA